MDWSLLDLAKEAEDVASGLQAFIDALPGCERDFLAHISALFAVSAELRRLDELVTHRSFRRAAAQITAELDLLCPSLESTLETVKSDLFGVKVSANPRRAYERLRLHFEQEGRSFSGRLVAYHDLTMGLSDVLQGDKEIEDLDVVVSVVRRLRARQAFFDTERIESPPAPLRPSPVRPPLWTAPQYAPQSPVISSDDWDSDGMYPAAPQAPLSPAFSNSSFDTFASFPTSPSLDSAGSYSPIHWAQKIFDGLHPVTQFLGHLGQPTRCLGRDYPEAVNRLFAEGFQKVVEQPFDAADSFVRLYWRPTDHRSRLLFLTKDPLGRRYRHCIPLTSLNIRRVGTCLQLSRGNQYDGRLDLWANLRFTCYERMVLFFCTAAALKRQDAVDSPLRAEDFFQNGEDMEFSGQIQDDHYLHAFRVFKDRNTGAVRFEATARRGPMHKTPIWTAFVTQYIGRKGWMRRVGSRILSMSALHPYIFCDNYSPPRGRDGQFELRFTSRKDCDDFLAVFPTIRVP
ncbi:uncharacterized protein BKCO1_200083 [Diplodia corticola]|uniref:Uncharacterized protein n=1 Tax=Diplodia corticola TaxID=236234 RepID=A0A1J9SJN6_9PEZI|nr:uncharacterized protein BKCO1_200083 [Diplodia corticola]OJD39813.1 hypothetical protein BKCO1_200083 [Diplodia corticola]